MDHVGYVLYVENEQEKKKWWATALSKPHIPTKSLTQPTTFSDTSNLISRTLHTVTDYPFYRPHPAAAVAALQLVYCTLGRAATGGDSSLA